MAGRRLVLDFYFPGIRLAIKIDGGYHRAQAQWRQGLRRTADLESAGITVLRKDNAEAFGDRARLIECLRAGWRLAALRVRQDSYVAREPLAFYGAAELEAAFWLCVRSTCAASTADSLLVLG